MVNPARQNTPHLHATPAGVQRRLPTVVFDPGDPCDRRTIRARRAAIDAPAERQDVIDRWLDRCWETGPQPTAALVLQLAGEDTA